MSVVFKETLHVLQRGKYTCNKRTVCLDRDALTCKATMVTQHPKLPSPRATPATLTFVADDTLAAAAVLANPVVLVFSSDSNPGGGCASNQQGTQEESICRRSSLQPSLARLPYPIPTGGVAYVPRVQVFRDASYAFLEHPFEIGAICGALREIDTTPKARAAALHKIQLVLATAAARGHASIVLGAWGCGAFGNDVTTVAALFSEAVVTFRHHFDVIVFAIPKPQVLRAFQFALTGE